MRAFCLCLIAGSFVAASAFADPAPTTFTVDGVIREALIYFPATSQKSKAPVIFAFHGHGGNMHFSANGMPFQKYWPEAIVVYPQGLPTPGIVLDHEGKKPGWQREAGQENDRDLKFVDAIVKSLREKYSIDDARIYATGFSNGGLFTYLLLSQRPNVFAAFAPGGAALMRSVQLTRPRPVFHYGGEIDQLARFSRQLETIEQLRQFNGCTAQGQSCGAQCTIYNSSKGAPVATFIHPLGHLYPQQVTPLIVKFSSGSQARTLRREATSVSELV
jgi:polyhydroxybutyrate depolymerase